MAPLLHEPQTPAKGSFSAFPAHQGYPCAPARQMRSRDLSSAVRSRAWGKLPSAPAGPVLAPFSLFLTSDNQADA